MESILVHRRPDWWQFGDLVSDRLGVVALQRLVAPAAFGRLAVDDVPELLGRDKRTGLTLMAGLPAPLLARGRSGRTSLERGGSEEGGLEELVEYLLSRSSRSAIRRSKDWTSTDTAACASGERVSTVRAHSCAVWVVWRDGYWLDILDLVATIS
jgi:hypothetical protein